jgi:hypothetical protein
MTINTDNKKIKILWDLINSVHLFKIFHTKIEVVT